MTIGCGQIGSREFWRSRTSRFTVCVLHYESRGFLPTTCISMECQTLVQKHRNQFDVLAAAAQLASAISPGSATRVEIRWDWRASDFVLSPIARATHKAGRER